MPKGRILHYHSFPFSNTRIGRRLSVAICALWHLPAFLPVSCTLQNAPDSFVPGMRKAQIYILPTGNAKVQGIDLLFFQDEPLFLLDAWQHFDAVQGNRVTGTASSAARSFVALSGYPGGSDVWSGIRSYDSLAEIRFRLEDEAPGAPLLFGTGEAGGSRTVVLQPMLARISLRSVACDFSGHPYAGEELTGVRAFLTWASRECRPFVPADTPVSWLNAGRLDETETATLPHPELVLADLTPSLGGRIYPDADFYCYPNPSDGSEFGRPVTRLVIEGKLRGVTYYYPIDLPGLEANVQYRMDVTLTRAGTTDPDTPAVAGTIVLTDRVLDWDGRELDAVHYH